MTPLGPFSWCLLSLCSCECSIGLCKHLKLSKRTGTVIPVQKHTTPPSKLLCKLHWGPLLTADISILCHVYLTLCLCSVTFLFLYKCCHLDTVPPDCSHCKHVHWVERNCCFSFLNHLPDSVREQTTCFFRLNMYVVKYVMLFISCK